MKENTLKWMKVWGWILAGAAGIPTLGFTWCILLQFKDWPKPSWQLNIIEALEIWLSAWETILVILAGIPTLGYAWAFWGKFVGKYIYLSVLREKYVPTKQIRPEED